MRVRDITEHDIPLMVDYWFNTNNQRYHEIRGAYGPDQKAFLQSQAELYRKQIAIPAVKRNNTTIILEYNLQAVAQVHLNDIRDEKARRIHFHPWIKAMPNRSFGQTISFWREAGPLSLRHFFSMYQLNEIIGDVSATNKIANFCLNRMGYEPTESVVATYIGAEGLYNRYRFYPV